jgi:hypothetical protein
MNVTNDIKKETVNVHAEKDMRKHAKHLGRVRLQKGQTLFEVNLQTRQVQPATYDEVAADLNGSVVKKVFVKDHCVYIPAINKENACRKFLKQFEEFEKQNPQ